MPEPAFEMRYGLFLAAFLAALLATSCSSLPKRAVESMKRGSSIDLIEEGGALEEEGLYQQAIDRYLKAVDSKPSPQAYYRLGHCYRSLGEYQMAAVYLRKAVDASPGFALARYELSYVEDLIGAEAEADREALQTPAPEPAEPETPAESQAPAEPQARAVQQSVPGRIMQPVEVAPFIPPSPAGAEAREPVEPLALSMDTGETFRPRPLQPALKAPLVQTIRTRPQASETGAADDWQHMVEPPLPPAGAGVAEDALDQGTAKQKPRLARAYEVLFGKSEDSEAPPEVPVDSSGATYFEDARFLVEHGDDLMGRGEFQKAIDEYLAALRKDDQDAATRVKLAEAYLALNRPEKAKPHVVRASEIEPSNFDAAFRLAEICWANGEYHQALAEAERAVSLDGENAGALLLLGDICKKLERETRAESLYLEAARLEPQSPRPSWKLGNLRAASQRFDEARALFEKSLELDPEFIPAYNNLAVLDQRDKDYKAAKANLERVIDLDPQWEKAVFNLAVLHDVYLNEPGKALKRYEQYLKLGGDRGDEARAAIARIKASE